MNWLEIIELRAVNGSHKKYESGLKNILEEFQESTTNYSIKIYNRLDLESDISIHILHQSDKPNINGSLGGAHLLEALKKFGLTNHTIWTEKLEI